jgi:hypothetical protein
MHATLTPVQELIFVELRIALVLPTDDLLAVAREFVNRRFRAPPWCLQPA